MNNIKLDEKTVCLSAIGLSAVAVVAFAMMLAAI